MAAGMLPLARRQCRQESRQVRSRAVPCPALPAACSPHTAARRLQGCSLRHRSPSLCPAVIQAVAPPYLGPWGQAGRDLTTLSMRRYQGGAAPSGKTQWLRQQSCENRPPHALLACTCSSFQPSEGESGNPPRPVKPLEEVNVAASALGMCTR